MSGPLAAGCAAALTAAGAAAVGVSPGLQALLCVVGGAGAFVAAAALRGRRRRSFRTRELERLSRCLFAAAGGARRRSRFR